MEAWLATAAPENSGFGGTLEHFQSCDDSTPYRACGELLFTLEEDRRRGKPGLHPAHPSPSPAVSLSLPPRAQEELRLAETLGSTRSHSTKVCVFPSILGSCRKVPLLGHLLRLLLLQKVSKLSWEYFQ